MDKLRKLEQAWQDASDRLSVAKGRREKEYYMEQLMTLRDAVSLIRMDGE
jgi:hypothetical protein